GGGGGGGWGWVGALRAGRGAVGCGGVRLRTMTRPDASQDHGSPGKCDAEAGLDATTIVRTARDTLPAETAKAEPASNVVSVRRRPR
ncbi:1-deoxy-D-xylulose-5-phosphate synthase, partial [Methylobacterium radiotolerans]